LPKGMHARDRDCFGVLQGHLAHQERPPPQVHHRALGIGLQ